MDNVVQTLNTKDILVIGDVMLDHYVTGAVERISPEAPVPVVQVGDEKFLLGGAANVANNLISIGAKVHVMSIVGMDKEGRTLTRILEDKEVDTELIDITSTRQTTIKTRVLAGQQQMMRIDREDTRPMTEEQHQRLADSLARNWDRFDAIILSDYGKGLLSDAFLEQIRKLHKEHPKIVAVDPKDRTFQKYRNFSYLTPNQLEAEMAIGSSIDDEAQLLSLGAELKDRLALDALLITLGARGMCLFDGNETMRIPTKAQEVFDVTGAGDTVISVFTACLSCGLGYDKSAKAANHAAGIVVGKVGAATISKDELKWICKQLD